MNVLIVADDDSALPFLAGLAEAGHTVVGWWAKSPVVRLQLARIAPQAGEEQAADLLLPSQQNCDAVLVAGTEPQTFAVARQLGSIGLPLLVVTTNAGPVSALFELMPVWEERRAWVVPVFTSELEGQEHLLRKGWEAAGISQPERFEFQRQAATAGSSVPLTELYRLLFQDLGWLTRVNGVDQASVWEQVTTLWSGQQPEALAQGTVKFTGANVPEATWTITASSADAWIFRVWGQGQQWQISSDNPAWAPATDQVRQTLNNFAELIKQPCILPYVRTWKDVLHCGQLLAAVQQSALRQRQVAIRYEEISGRSQFKSQMSAIGCGTLLWAMFAGMGWLLVAATLDPRDREQKAAEASGFVFELDDFHPHHGPLTTEGLAQVDHVAQNWTASTAPVILNVSADVEVNETERLQLAAALAERLGTQPSPERIQLRKLPGGWFHWVIILGWCAVFGPLVLFLLAQGLIVATRPELKQGSN